MRNILCFFRGRQQNEKKLKWRIFEWKHFHNSHSQMLMTFLLVVCFFVFIQHFEPVQTKEKTHIERESKNNFHAMDSTNNTKQNKIKRKEENTITNNMKQELMTNNFQHKIMCCLISFLHNSVCFFSITLTRVIFHFFLFVSIFFLFCFYMHLFSFFLLPVCCSCSFCYHFLFCVKFYHCILDHCYLGACIIEFLKV